MHGARVQETPSESQKVWSVILSDPWAGLQPPCPRHHQLPQSYVRPCQLWAAEVQGPQGPVWQGCDFGHR